MIFKILKWICDYFSLLRRQYNLLVPGLAQILVEHNCQYQSAFRGGFCCFNGIRVELDSVFLVSLMRTGDFNGIKEYLYERIREVKKKQEVTNE